MPSTIVSIALLIVSIALFILIPYGYYRLMKWDVHRDAADSGLLSLFGFLPALFAMIIAVALFLDACPQVWLALKWS